MRILIIGGTGNVGREAARMLLSTDRQVRLFIRNPAKARKYGLDKAELIVGDVRTQAKVEEALQGVDSVFSALSAAGPGRARYLKDVEEDANKHLIDAAGKAGVKKFVYLSVLRADTPEASSVPHFEIKARVERYLKVSTVPWTIIRPCAFQESLLQQMMLGNIGIIMGRQRCPIRFVAIQDIAAAASALCQQEGGDGRIVELFGPQALTYSEAYRELSFGWGRRVPVLRLPLGLALQSAAVLKRVDPFIANAVAMFAYFDGGGFTVETPDMSIWKEIGRDPSPVQRLGERLRTGDVSPADYRVFP